MNFFTTSLGIFIFKAIATAVAVGGGVMLFKSAVASFKRTGKWTSVLDEIVVGFIVLVVYALVVANEPITIVNFLTGPILFFWDLILRFLRETLGLGL